MPLDDNNDGHYDLWDFYPETYDCFLAYYDLYSDEDNVLVYEQGGVCDSDINEEEDMEIGMEMGGTMGMEAMKGATSGPPH